MINVVPFLARPVVPVPCMACRAPVWVAPGRAYVNCRACQARIDARWLRAGAR